MSIRRVDTAYRGDTLQLSLKDFLECFPPPQSGRIVDDFQPDFDAHEAFNISKGAVLNFHRQVSPSVPLSFRDPWGGLRSDQMVRVTLPLEFQGKFRLLHYDPVSGSSSPDHIYRRVQDVVAAFPVYIQANAYYKGSVTGSQSDNDLSNVLDNSFTYGDRFKLIRLVHKNGKKQLECRKVDEVRILLLPMDCVGNFTVLPDNNEYLLSDLMSMLPRKRRIVVCECTKDKYKIPGLPAGFSGDLFLEEPEAFVEASPMDDPGLIIGLPSSLSLRVSPEEDSYDRGQLLNSFATNNRNAFPVVARVTDWDEETTILENHYVKPGIELVIHGWTRQSKVLAMADGRHYAIPLTYQGKFRFVGQTFNSVADLERAHPAYALRVIDADAALALQPGDVIRIKRGDSLRKGTGFLRCEKVEQGKPKEIKIPVNARGRFEEVLEGNKTSDEYSIRELVPFVAEASVDVQLIVGSTDQKVKSRDLCDDVIITLCDYVVESAVYVSVETAEAPAFHIPLRTLVYVTFVQELEKQLSPLLMRQNPRLSTLDRCVEVLPEEVFSALRPRDRSPSSDGNRRSYSPLQPNTNSLRAPTRWPGLAPKATSASTGALNSTLTVARSTSPARNVSQIHINEGGSVGSHSNGSRVEVPMSTGSSSTSSRLVPSTDSLETTSSSSNKRESPVSDEQRPASRARSYVEGELTKRKSLSQKIRNRFRRHKSTENVNKVSNHEFSALSLPREENRTPIQDGKSHHLAKYNSVDLNSTEPIIVSLEQDTDLVEDDILQEQIKKLQEHQQQTITRHIHTVEIHNPGREEEPMAEGSTSTPSPTPPEPQATYINVTTDAPPLRSSSPTPSSVSQVPPRTATPSVVSIPISSVSTAGQNSNTIVQQNNMLNATMMNSNARTVEGQGEADEDDYMYVPEAVRQQMVQQQMYSQQQQVLAQQQQVLAQQLAQQPQVREMYVARRPDGQVQAFLPPTSNPNHQPMVRKPVLYRNPATGQVNQGYVLVPAPGYNNNQQQQMIQNQYVQTSQGYVMMPMMNPQMMMQQQQQQQQQQRQQQTQQQQQQMINRNNSIEDDEDTDDSVEFTDANFTSNKQFKLAIPLDGNLYGFSSKKMAEFFRQLKLSDECVQKCIKAKVDGKKFSRMSEMDLDTLDLMHPLVVHFRRLTYKKKFNFML